MRLNQWIQSLARCLKVQPARPNKAGPFIIAFMWHVSVPSHHQAPRFSAVSTLIESVSEVFEVNSISKTTTSCEQRQNRYFHHVQIIENMDIALFARCPCDIPLFVS